MVESEWGMVRGKWLKNIPVSHTQEWRSEKF